MRTSLRGDLTAALKARDHVAVAALRSALAAIENAEAVPVERPAASLSGNEHFAGSTSPGEVEAVRRELTEADVRSIVEREVRERADAAREYAGLGREDHAQRLRAEAEVLRRYL
jgi:uncharacterized protein